MSGASSSSTEPLTYPRATDGGGWHESASGAGPRAGTSCSCRKVGVAIVA